MVGDGFYIQKQALLRRMFIDVNASGARAISSANGIIGRRGGGAAERFHGHDVKLVLRQTPK